MKNCILVLYRIAEHGCHFSVPAVYQPHPFCWPASIVLMRSRSKHHPSYHAAYCSFDKAKILILGLQYSRIIGPALVKNGSV